MNNIYIKNIVRFLVLVIVQVLVLNKIQLNGYINPYLYVLFILLLPFDTPKWFLLIAGFILGLIIDFFSNPLGMHAAATVFVAFLRPYVISIISTEDEFEQGEQPGIRDMGFTWFFSYALILVLMHHMVYFYLEIFRLNEIATTLLRILISTAVTVLLMILSLYIFNSRK